MIEFNNATDILRIVREQISTKESIESSLPKLTPELPKQRLFGAAQMNDVPDNDKWVGRDELLDELKQERIIGGLSKHRCLVVLDNLESLLCGAGSGKAIDSNVDHLLNRLVDGGHKSQIIITSRELTQLPDFHKDPADQIIVATSIIAQIPLLTADEQIIAYPNVITLG